MDEGLQSGGLTIREKTIFPADTCSSERQKEQNKVLSAQAARSACEDNASCSEAPGLGADMELLKERQRDTDGGPTRKLGSFLLGYMNKDRGSGIRGDDSTCF